jgi:hypothetical protein
MTHNVSQNIKESTVAFESLIWPKIIDKLGGGTVVSVETRSTYQGLQELDLLAGIDAWQIMPDSRGMRGIAQRAQKNIDYKSFTIRYSTGYGNTYTEYQKRYEAINSSNGLIYPHYTIQAFYKSSLDDKPAELISVAAVKTTDLINFVDIDNNRGYVRTNSYDGSQFIVVYWDQLEKHGIELIKAD